MVQPVDMVMHEQVLPWMMDRIIDFLEEDIVVESNVENIFENGYGNGNTQHRLAVV